MLEISVTRGNETLGYVVVDSTVAGTSRGGLRLAPCVGLPELRDAARNMTLKFGFLGLAQGGAKAGVLGDPDSPLEVRRQRLTAFGEAASAILRRRVYLPDADMGTRVEDVRALLAAAGVRIRRREWNSGRSGYYTALTVLCGITRSLAQIGSSLAGRTVAIQGFGKVGAELAALAVEQGARVVAVSTAHAALLNPKGLDIGRLINLAQLHGAACVTRYDDAERTPPESLLEFDVDVLCPCAGWRSIHDGNADRVRARVVCSGANTPMTTEAERSFFGRGIVCLPDFVTNSGGVLGGTLAYAGVPDHRIASFIDRYLGPRMTSLLDEAARRMAPPAEIAVPRALRRHSGMARRAERPPLASRCVSAALGLYARGWVPRWLTAALACSYLGPGVASDGERYTVDGGEARA